MEEKPEGKRLEKEDIPPEVWCWTELKANKRKKKVVPNLVLE